MSQIYAVRIIITWPSGLNQETIQLAKVPVNTFIGRIFGTAAQYGPDRSSFILRLQNSWIPQYGLEPDYYARAIARFVDVHCSREGSQVGIAVYRETAHCTSESARAMQAAVKLALADIPGLELVAMAEEQAPRKSES